MALTSSQISNANILQDVLIKKGITNKVVIAAILAVIQKESEFLPRNESFKYSPERLLAVFGKAYPSKVPNLAAAQQIVAKGEKYIADFLYTGGGNGVNEGYKYRGRGYNQITFKNNYKDIGTAIGRDLVNNPDLLLNPIVAAEAAVHFFKKNVKILYPTVDLNKITDLHQAVTIAYNVNAGKDGRHKTDTTGGFKKATNYVNELFDFVGGKKLPPQEEA